MKRFKSLMAIVAMLAVVGAVGGMEFAKVASWEPPPVPTSYNAIIIAPDPIGVQVAVETDPWPPGASAYAVIEPMRILRELQRTLLNGAQTLRDLRHMLLSGHLPRRV